MKEWKSLPKDMQVEEIKPYYRILKKRKCSLFVKRIFDIIVSAVLIILLFPVLVVLSIWIKMDSNGPVIFRQERITTYGRVFRIYKFRTMISDAEKRGSQVTTKGDPRITDVGAKIRRCRLDELPQLFNIFLGDMTFVGTRPEVIKYVNAYTPEMKATLLMPAGVTSRASIEYKDENVLLEKADNADEVYIRQILPEKMKYNLQEIKRFSFGEDLKIMIATVLAVIK